MRSTRFIRGLSLFVLSAALLVSPQAAAVPPDPGVVADFDELIRYIGTIPDSDLNKGQKNSFSQRLENAKRQYSDGQICAAANMLGAHLNESQAARKKSAAAAEQLYSRGRALLDGVLRAATPSDPCFDPSAGQVPAVQIVASDNRHFSGRISFGAPVLTPMTGGGESWTHVSLPGLENLLGPAGRPAVPSWQALVAVPRGAKPRLTVNRAVTGEQVLLNLFPYQNQAADQVRGRFDDEPLPPRDTFKDPPFVKNPKAYETDQFWPPDPCNVRMIDNVRNLLVAQIQCNAGQYNPVTDQMRLFDSVEFDVAFEGGDGKFSSSQIVSPFEPASSSIVSNVLNTAIVGSYLEITDLTRLPCLGEELLILTHPTFRPAADDLAEWKRDKGISTNVFEVGAGTARATGAQIDAFIESRYDNCAVRPSYVLLLGDSEFVPPARTNHDTTASCGSCGDMTNGSDWVYATYSGSLFGFLPWFAVGRMPVDTAAEAQTVVDKTIQYESNPPFLGIFGGGAPFYTTAMNASYFQCCQTGSPAGRDMRTFVQTSETVRNAMVAAGKTVQRIYNTNTDYQDEFIADTTPRRYFSGAALPAALAPGSGFGWTGNTTDIINAFNNGRYLILHRDHGGSTAWSDPSFSTTNLASLTNGAMLPFVFSVNCASGFWDRETDSGSTTESLMEQLLLRANGGMVAGLGDNRNSPTWANSALTRGFYDALYPSVAPEFSTSTVKRRLADILDHGKIYLLTQYGVAQPAGDVTLEAVTGEWVMWHAFGDPTAEIWLSNPHSLVLPVEFVLELSPTVLRVQYATDGATITAFQEGKNGLAAIARGTVVGGVANIPYFQPPDPAQPIILTASLANSISVLLTRGTLPDLVVDSLALPTINLTAGQDLAGILRVKVGNLGGSVGRGTVNADGSVRPPGIGYMVDLVLSRDTSVPPGFATVPLPAGVAFIEDGLLLGGRVSRTPDVAAGAHFDLPTFPPISSGVGGVIPLQAGGELHLCARIDPGNAVIESNEANNVTCTRVNVFPPLR